MTCQTIEPSAPHTVPTLCEVLPEEPDYSQFASSVAAAVSRVARRYRLNPTDIEDLHSDVWLKLLADRGRALRRFRGTSRLSTYLTAVAVNVLRDRRNHEWGKWRPSAAAARQGSLAVTIDRLLSRDGLWADHAFEWLRTAGFEVNESTFQQIVASLPKRSRRMMVGASMLDSHPANAPTPFDHQCLEQTQDEARSVSRQLARAMSGLPSRDRDLLAWRYRDGHSVAEIALALGVNQKHLYRRFETILEHLREALSELGVELSELRDLFAADRFDMVVDFQANAIPAPRLRRSA